jgi:chromosome segregation ATPase
VVKKGQDLGAFTVRAGGAPTEEQLIGTRIPVDVAQILTPLRGLVEEQIADVRRQVAGLTTQRDCLQAEAIATRSDLDRLQTTRANLVKECDERGQELATLREQVASARGELDVLQQRRIAKVEETERITRENEQELTQFHQRQCELATEVTILATQVEMLRQFLPAAPITVDLSTVPAEFRENLRDQVNARLPIVDVKALTHAANQSGTQKQDIIKAALRAYLGEEAYRAACHGLGLAAMATHS